MRLPRFHDLPRAVPLMAVLLCGACGKLSSLTGPKTSASESIAAVTLVQGDLQTAQAGRALGTPVVLRLVDAKGKGVAGQPVTLVVTSGGGTVTPATAVSDSLGELTVKWTLGSAQVTQTLTASADGVDPIVVHATALFPLSLVVAQGVSQSG